MKCFVALARAVNVGGKNPLSMAKWREVAESEGFQSVETILQSGNMVFLSSLLDPSVISEKLQSATANSLGVQTEIIVKRAAVIERIVIADSFSSECEREPNQVLVFFMSDKPQEDDLMKAREKAPTERILAVENDLVVHFPDGVGSSKLTTSAAWKHLTRKATGRNWSTVLKLHELCQRLGSYDSDIMNVDHDNFPDPND